MTDYTDEIAELLGEDKPKRKRKRPVVAKNRSHIDQALHRRRLLAWISTGQHLNTYVKKSGTPSLRTLHVWIESDPVFAEEYRHARLAGFDAIARDCLSIADTGDETDVRHRALRINTRLKLLARWDPARYGNKIQVGGDGGEPIKLSHDDTVQRVLALIAVAKKRQLADPNNRVNGQMN